QVDAAEGWFQRRYGFDHPVDVGGIDLDVEDIDASELLEQDGLAFHHRLGCQRADIAQAEHGRPVGHNGDKVGAARVVGGQRRIITDRKAGRGNTRRIGKRQVALIAERLGRLDFHLSGRRMLVEIERGLFEIGPCRFSGRVHAGRPLRSFDFSYHLVTSWQTRHSARRCRAGADEPVQPLKCAHIGTAVHRYVLAGQVAGMDGTEESADLPELLGRAEPFRRYVGRQPLLARRLLLGSFDTARLLRSAQAVGVDLPRQEVVDGNVPFHHRPGDPRKERGQTGPRAGRKVESRQRHVDGKRRNVDDASEAPCGHAVNDRLYQFDGRDHIVDQALEDLFAVEFAEIAEGRPPVIVDEYINFRESAQQRFLHLRLRYVANDLDYLYAPSGAQLVCGPGQRVGVAAVNDQVAAGFRKRRRATPSEALAGGADDRLPAPNSQIHRKSPLNKRKLDWQRHVSQLRPGVQGAEPLHTDRDQYTQPQSCGSGAATTEPS